MLFLLENVLCRWLTGSISVWWYIRAGTFGMTFSEILKFGIAMNIFAGLGAFVFAWVEDWLTSKTTIFISLIGLVAFGSACFLLKPKLFLGFWPRIKFFYRPCTVGQPRISCPLITKTTSWRNVWLFAMSGKATSFIGPMLLVG